MCFSFDPSWVPPNAPPMGYLKKDFSVQLGQFVDHCPTENVIATCDFRGKLPRMDWYYQGMTEANVALRKQLCVGKYVRVAAAPSAIAKLQLDTTRTVLGACDLRNAPEGNGRGTCVEYRADSPPHWFDTAKQMCTSMIARCPIPGATGRCDLRGVLTYYYLSDRPNVAEMNVGFRAACESTSGTWSQP